MVGCDGSEEFSASSVKKTPGGWGGYEEKEASNTSFKLQGKLSGFAGRKTFKFLKRGNFI